MSAEILEVLGQLLTCRVSGTLTQAELSALQRAAEPIIQATGKIRLLVLVEDFTGWERGAEWSDLSFQQENDAYIERMALVGEKKWEVLAEAFTGKGFRDFPIEYFGAGEMGRALRWLSEE